MENALVWSCGGGTQSAAIAALIIAGKLPKPDISFIIDTEREKTSTWEYYDSILKPELATVGVDLVRVPKSDFATVDLYSLKTGMVLIPAFTNQSGSVGKFDGFCSGEWKRRVSERYLRSLGVESCTMWIGFSTDEMRRVRASATAWLTRDYPLIFRVPSRRSDCVSFVRLMGWPDPPRSACYMCPEMADAEWLDMKLNYPADFWSAVQFERIERQRDPHFFLHPACIPLDEVDFESQQTMFADRGCREGCFT